jgi:hypothetical protein
MRRGLFGLLDDMWVQLLDANVLAAIKLVHDPALTDKERAYIQNFIDITCNDDEDGSD